MKKLIQINYLVDENANFHLEDEERIKLLERKLTYFLPNLLEIYESSQEKDISIRAKYVSEEDRNFNFDEENIEEENIEPLPEEENTVEKDEGNIIVNESIESKNSNSSILPD